MTQLDGVDTYDVLGGLKPAAAIDCLWLLATRNRPQLVQEMIDTMTQTGDVPRCAVMQDACRYDIDWPQHWHVHASAEHLEMAGALQALFRLYPNEPCYGMLDDHTHPVAAGWSSRLAQAAGSWRIASAVNDKNRTKGERRRINNYAIGGELARALGWVWPSFVVHLFGDDVLEDIGYALGILTFVEDAGFRSLLLRDGTLKADANSARRWRGESYTAHDAAAYREWRRHEMPELLEHLRSTMR